MFDKAKHAEEALALALTLLEDQDRRIAALEHRVARINEFPLIAIESTDDAASPP